MIYPGMEWFRGDRVRPDNFRLTNNSPERFIEPEEPFISPGYGHGIDEDELKEARLQELDYENRLLMVDFCKEDLRYYTGPRIPYYRYNAILLRRNFPGLFAG